MQRPCLGCGRLIPSGSRCKRCRGGVPGRQRRALLSARGRRCERCGAADVALEVHHRDHDPTNNAAANLAVLCRPCHRGGPHAT